MKQNDFDIKVELKVRVLPRQAPNDMVEKIKWEGLENRVNFEGRKLGYSLEGYFESLASELLQEPCSHIHACCCGCRHFCPDCGEQVRNN